MQPEEIKYNLVDGLNRARFKKLLRGKGYKIYEGTDLSRFPNQREVGVIRKDPQSECEGALVGITLYVFCDAEGKIYKGLEKLAREFEIE